MELQSGRVDGSCSFEVVVGIGEFSLASLRVNQSPGTFFVLRMLEVCDQHSVLMGLHEHKAHILGRVEVLFKVPGDLTYPRQN